MKQIFYKARNLFIVFILFAGGAHAQVVDQGGWITDGEVNAIGQQGNTLYVGGAFDQPVMD